MGEVRRGLKDFVYRFLINPPLTTPSLGRGMVFQMADHVCFVFSVNSPFLLPDNLNQYLLMNPIFD